MANTINIARSFQYQSPGNDYLKIANSSRATITKTERQYEGTVGDRTLEIHVVDFVVDDPDTTAVTLVIAHTGVVTFVPEGTYSPAYNDDEEALELTFPVPQANQPAFAWTSNHPPTTGGGTPGFALRVTVKRKG